MKGPGLSKTGSLRSGLCSGRTRFLVLLPFFYAAMTWWFTGSSLATNRDNLLWYVLASSAALSLPYLVLLQRDRPPVSLRWGFVVALFAPLVTPSLLQTDQLRYIWDGVVLASGHNPFALSPSEALAALEGQGWTGVVPSPSGLPVPATWAQAINHPGFVTVYSPLALLAFAAGSWLNPFFHVPFINDLFGPWAELLPVLSWWPWEIGWRLVVGLALMAMVWLLRGKRWDLVLFHPLVFLTGFANVHVDVLLLPVLVFLFAARTRAQPERGGLALGFAILVRWTPVVLLPAFAYLWRRRLGRLGALHGVGLALSLVAVGFALFLPGSGGRLFASAAAYSEHWMFFGFAHRFVSDILAGTGWVPDPINVTKGLLGTTWIVVAWRLVTWAHRRHAGVQLVSLCLLTCFFVVTPTLHPWYFLPLLVVGLPYMKVLLTPWLWPMLAPLSYTFYFENADPTAVRSFVYVIVSAALIRDGRYLFGRGQRSPKSAASPPGPVSASN